MDEFTKEQKKDLKVLIDFVKVHCAARHTGQTDLALPADLMRTHQRQLMLCPDCQALLNYALLKRRKCPLTPKPSCKHCRIHCYSYKYRAKIREIMAFSGRRMILRGRLDYLWHYFF